MTRPLQQAFRHLFGNTPQGFWAGPGRVNLIGEHTDYNEGFVLPFAIDRRASVAVRLRDDTTIRVASRQQGDGIVACAVDDLEPLGHDGWASYVLGVAWALGVTRGFDLLVDSDVPIGAGLSSSAALETATALALNDLLSLDHTRMELAQAAHRAEGEFVGAPVGLMDQLVSACAIEGSALLIDCRSLDLRPVSFDASAMGCVLLVIDTGAAHTNNDGAYADRRTACEKAAADLGLKSLREATPTQVAHLPMARHVVSENARVLQAVEAVEAVDAGLLGELMVASHASLRDDFEVSSPQLDTAVDTALAAGALGARLTGAGFGGSAITLVPSSLVAEVTSRVHDGLVAKGFARPAIFPVVAGPGARRLSTATHPLPEGPP